MRPPLHRSITTVTQELTEPSLERVSHGPFFWWLIKTALKCDPKSAFGRSSTQIVNNLKNLDNLQC